jgi:hypothetical protein
MNNFDSLVPGDILLVRGGSFISKAIRWHLELYRKQLGIDKREVFSHAATVVEIWGKKYVVEAESNGININPLDDTYGSKDPKDILIKTPRKPYSKVEQELMNTSASKDAFNPHRYDFMAFVYQIDMIKRTRNTMDKKWAGPTGNKATDRLYCSEACATWANIVRPGTFDKPWSVNPLDIDLNKYYINKVIV